MGRTYIPCTVQLSAVVWFALDSMHSSTEGMFSNTGASLVSAVKLHKLLCVYVRMYTLPVYTLNSVVGHRDTVCMILYIQLYVPSVQQRQATYCCSEWVLF